MFGILKFIFRWTIILLLLAGVAGYFTNPTLDDFKHAVKDKLSKEYKEQISSPVFSGIAELGLDFAAGVAENNTKRDDYVIFSIYTIPLPTGEFQYLGIFKQFIPLQSENPIPFNESN